jgi:hypothetical protein
MGDLEAVATFEKYKEHLDTGENLRGLSLAIAYYEEKQKITLIERELLQLALKGAETAKAKLR